MLTLSILWVALAAIVTVIAILRKTAAGPKSDGNEQSSVSGHALALFAVIYGVALLAGFLFVSKFLVSTL